MPSGIRAGEAAGIAQLVEHLLAMQKVASSSLVSRSFSPPVSVENAPTLHCGNHKPSDTRSLVRNPGGVMPFIGLLLLVMVSSCDDGSMTPVIEEMQAEDAPFRESWGVHTITTRAPMGETSSHRQMEFIADYVAWHMVEDAEHQRLVGLERPVKVVLYDSVGSVAATLTAWEVRYAQEVGQMDAMGEVRLETYDDKLLVTEALTWHEDARTIRSDSLVSITSATEDIQGYGLVADEDLATYEIGRFTARIVLEE